MGPAPWAQQLLTLLAPHLLKPPGEQEEQDPPTQVCEDGHPSAYADRIIIYKCWYADDMTHLKRLSEITKIIKHGL